VDWASQHHVKLSLTVATLAGDRHVAEHDGTALRNPASVSKLITAYVALKTLGPSYQFRTTLHGRLLDGHIQRLSIRGEGDPSLISDNIFAMAARLSAMGFTAVDAPIVVDQSYFDDRFVPPAFDQQPDEWAPFRAPVCPTAVDKNRLALRVAPQGIGANALVFVEPLGAVDLAGQIRSVDRDTKGTKIRWSILSGGERPTVRVDGEVGVAEKAFTLERRVDDPRKMVGHVLRQALLTRGIKVPSEVTLGATEGLPRLIVHESDALSILLHRLGKESDNFAAEMLLKTIGARASGVGSSDNGARAVAEWLLRLGPVGSEVRLVNGSGLFDANRASTNLLVRLLVEAFADKVIAPEYLAQLSIAGGDGTLSKRMRKLPSGCVVRAKTGTLRSTISLAGLIGRQDGNDLAFAILADEVKDQASTRAEIDRFVEDYCTALLQ
jgi:D-alanyl-D-alanine carboxypeptidase/D-alanyl-D-alanine-endopeptidase (penicillin-binding protein 4)